VDERRILSLARLGKPEEDGPIVRTLPFILSSIQSEGSRPALHEWNDALG